MYLSYGWHRTMLNAESRGLIDEPDPPPLIRPLE